MTPVPVPPPLPPLIDVHPSLFAVFAIVAGIGIGLKMGSFVGSKLVRELASLASDEKPKNEDKPKNEMPWEREARKQVAWALFRAHYPLQPEHLELLNLSNQYLAEHGYFEDGTPMDSIVGTVEMTIGDDGELVEVEDE